MTQLKEDNIIYNITALKAIFVSINYLYNLFISLPLFFLLFVNLVNECLKGIY